MNKAKFIVCFRSKDGKTWKETVVKTDIEIVEGEDENQVMNEFGKNKWGDMPNFAYCFFVRWV